MTQIKKWIHECCKRCGYTPAGITYVIRESFGVICPDVFVARAELEKREIKISDYWWDQLTRTQKRQVIFHETCHILSQSAHDKKWKKLMIKCGHKRPSKYTKVGI